LAPPPPEVFQADRPFLFLIRDVKHGTVLFLGRLTDPGK
jgi:serpin B